MQTKKCKICGEIKPLELFTKRKTNLDGRDCNCKQCHNNKHRQSYISNPSKYKTNRDRWQSENPKKVWCSSTICGHKKKFVVTVTTSELYELVKNKTTCDICGCKLDWSRGVKKHIRLNSPTLDRINNEQILTQQNIQILCSQCNVMKGNRPMNEFIAYCNMVGEKYGKTQSI